MIMYIVIYSSTPHFRQVFMGLLVWPGDMFYLQYSTNFPNLYGMRLRQYVLSSRKFSLKNHKWLHHSVSTMFALCSECDSKHEAANKMQCSERI